MAPTTFHYFPELPKSIREAIWAAAIRPNHPGVQIFTVYDTNIETARKLLSEYTTLGPPRLGDYALAAPLPDYSYSNDSDSSAGSNDQDDLDDSDEGGNSSDNSEIASWVKGNESTYLMDAGLWTACRESRAMIERWFEKIKNQDVNDKEDIPDAQAATWFVTDGESLPTRCLTHPRTDLFFLIFHNNQRIDWKRIPGLPFSTSYQRHSQYPVSHVALEFCIDSGWEEEGPQCVVKAASGELSWVRNLWFINFGLTRRVHVGTPPARLGLDSDQYRHRFYSNGYIYTEVRPYDTDWYVEDGNLSVSDFRGRLEIEVAKYCTKRDEAIPPYRPDGYEPRYIDGRPQVGVLAREKCAS